jgi:uncharacterized protein YceH (UPF0502 family)
LGIVLKNPEIRVLGSLIEKESTTPEYYPLTMNALVAACNQKSNRWPLTELTENQIREAIGVLRMHGFAAEITGGSRVPKYAQRFTEKLNLGRRETAILCVLMLRGHQTIGEIKSRTERMYNFADLDEVETVLQKMMNRPEDALVQKFAPLTGMKEPRFGHLLSGAEALQVAHTAPDREDRLTALEAEVARLREEVAELRRLIAE